MVFETDIEYNTEIECLDTVRRNVLRLLEGAQKFAKVLRRN